MRGIILTLSVILSLSLSFSQDNWRDSYKWIETDEEDMALYGKDYLKAPPFGVYEKIREKSNDSVVFYTQNSAIHMNNALPDIKSALRNIEDDLIAFGYKESVNIISSRIYELQKESVTEIYSKDKCIGIDINEDRRLWFIVNKNQFIIEMREYIKIKQS